MPVWIECLVAFGALTALTFLPGVALTYWLFPGKRLDLFERVPIGFALMLGLFTLPIALARALGMGWDQLLLMWIVLVVFALGIAVAVRRWQDSGESAPSRFARYIDGILPHCETPDDSVTQRPAPKILIILFVSLLVLTGLLTQIGPNDEDDWDYFRVVRVFADATPFSALSLSDRDAVNSWWFLHAAIVHLFDVDVVRLGQNWMPLIFAPMTFLAFYSLARALFLNQTIALLAVFIQFVFYMSDLFYADTVVIWNGWWILAHMDQGHTIVMSVLLPVLAALVVRYLRQGSDVVLGATVVVALGMIAVHGLLGILMPALTIFAVLSARVPFVRGEQEWKKIRRLVVVMGVLFILFSPVIASLLQRIMPPSALPQVLPTDVNFPFSRYRYTFFSPTLFTMKVEYLGHPPLLAAIFLTPFLIRFLRRDLAAQFLFGNMVSLLSILYVPFLMVLFESRMTTAVERLWHWIPDAFIVAYFLPHFRQMFKNGWLAWRRRLPNRHLLQAVVWLVICTGLLAVWPTYLLDGWPKPLGPGHALPTGAYEMLKALRDYTAPDEQATVFAWRDITDAIPAYRATLHPVLYRENPKSQQRSDADRFFSPIFVTNTHLDILTRYQVKYLIISGDREIVSQCDLLPDYFQPLYHNAYGTLYRVALPLEPNALIEANTLANFGEWEGAIEAYNAVLAEDPNNSLAHTGLGILLELLDKPRQAVREFEAAVDAAPTNAQAHAHLVYLYRKLGMDEQAAEHVQPAGRLGENLQ